MECLSFWNYSFLTLSFAFQHSSVRLGAATTDAITPYIYEANGYISFSYWLGFGLILITLITSIAFSLIDYCALKDNQHLEQRGEQVQFSGIANFPKVFWFIALSQPFIYGAIYTMSAISSSYVQTRFGFNLTSAGLIIVFFNVLYV